MQLGKTMQRLLVYFFYDKYGVIDDYVVVQLEDLRKNVDKILFVSNGDINPESKVKIKNIVNDIFIRENKGFDVWAYKEGMAYYGWKELCKYDEIILMNFTMYGPLYPFEEMFVTMDARTELDFWGITKHHGFDFDPFGTIPYGYIPEHIQSSFIGIRQRMTTSREFQDYWDNMTEVNSYGEAVGKHEAIFTKTFNELGFKSDVYIQTDDLKDYTHYPLMIMPLELVKNRRCPVIKRKSFTNEYYEFLNCTTGEPTVELYEYIQNNLDYDLDLIWDNLLRIENMADIKNRMHLNYVLPKFQNLNFEKEKKKVALMLHIYFEDLIDECFHYAENMPYYADIFVTTDTVKKKEKIEKQFKKLNCNKLTVIVIENRGRDVGALLVGLRKYIMDYDLVCFAHDKKTKQFKPFTIGKSFSYKCFENILGSKSYVENIIATFKSNKRLGVLTPPPPNHAAFFGIHGTEWGDNFKNTVDLLDKFNIKVNIDLYKEPIAPLGTMFWFRPKALSVLVRYDWKYEDFPAEPNQNDGTILHAIERGYTFFAQANGFYSAWVMNDKFAAMELTNLHFMLREISMGIYSIVGHCMGFAQANDLLRRLSWKGILKAKIKQKTPNKIWCLGRKIYRAIKPLR